MCTCGPRENVDVSEGRRDEEQKQQNVENTIENTSNGEVYRRIQGRGEKQNSRQSLDRTAADVHGVLQPPMTRPNKLEVFQT